MTDQWTKQDAARAKELDRERLDPVIGLSPLKSLGAVHREMAILLPRAVAAIQERDATLERCQALVEKWEARRIAGRISHYSICADELQQALSPVSEEPNDDGE